MAAAHQRWTVLPHGPLEQLAENLWRVEAALPDMPLRRVMVVVRLDDGGLLLHNPVALEEPTMKELLALGTPVFMVVPNGWHRLDAAPFKARYPALKVVAPVGARAKVAQVVPVDLAPAEVGAKAVAFEDVAGARQLETVMRVRSADGHTLVFTDLLFNLPGRFPGLWGLVYHLMGARPGPRVTWIGRTFMVRDRSAYRAQLERLAVEPELRRVIVAHGTPVLERAGDMLRQAATTLG
jgi:hypothetical protein